MITCFISAALQFPYFEGHIYTTVNDETFRATDEPNTGL